MLWLLLFLTVVASAGQIQRFNAPFHTVNNKSWKGESCDKLRDSRVVACPPYGLKVNGRTLDQFQNACADIHSKLACPIGTNLFVDGECRTCPHGFHIQEKNEDIWCEDDRGHILFKGLENPFNCSGNDALTPRSPQNSIRPCSNAHKITVSVPHYYKADDLNGELTMQECAVLLDVSDDVTAVSQYDFEATYDFPLIRTAGTERVKGFLVCPEAPPDPYSFATPGWVLVHTIASLTFGTILIFILYKYYMERGIGEGVRMSGETRQCGYVDCILGYLGYYSVFVITLSFQLLLLFYVLDLYGMHYKTLCSNPTILKACEVSVAAGIDPSWRVGYKCASGCLFDMSLTNGSAPEWPFVPAPGGGKRQQLVFLIIWGLSIIWCLLLRIFIKKIKCFFKLRVGLREAGWVLCCSPIMEEVKVAQWEKSFVMRTVRYMDYLSVKLLGPTEHTELCRVYFGEGTVDKAWERNQRKKLKKNLKKNNYENNNSQNNSRKNSAKNDSFFESKELRCTGTAAFSTNEEEQPHRHIDVRCMRCVWVEEEQCFKRVSVYSPKTQSEIFAQGRCGLSEEEAANRLRAGGLNSIDIRVPSYLEAIFLEFFDYFYFYQLYCLWIWYNFYYWLMASVIATTVIVSGVLKVVVRRNSQQRVKALAEMGTEVTIRRGNVWQKMCSSQIAPGDLMEIQAMSTVCCDLVLVQGRCVVDESALTGEPTPVPKIPVTDCQSSYVKNGTNMKYTLLAGTYVQSVASGSGEEAKTLAVVLDTGAETDKGKFIRNILFPSNMTFVFDEHWKFVFVILLIWGFLTGVLTVIMYGNLLEGWYFAAFNMSQVISPIIPAMFVAAEVKASKRLKKHKIFCVDLHRISVAAKVKIFCFDKTGTITKTGLDFYGVQSITEDAEFGPFYSASSSIPAHVRDLLGCCHELDVIDTPLSKSPSQVAFTSQKTIQTKRWWQRNKYARKETLQIQQTTEGEDAENTADNIVGNEVDKEMFLASNFNMPHAAAQPIVQHAVDHTKIKILKRFEFNRETMTMSVIVEDMQSGVRSVYCKGSFERIAEVMDPSDLPEDYVDETRRLAKEGFYLLGISAGPYNGPQDVNLASRDELERSLPAVGLLMFRNDLKPDSQDALQTLKEADIETIMITGDNALTAAKIARQCSLSRADNFWLAEVEAGQVVWKNVADDTIIPHPLSNPAQLISGHTELAVTGAAFEILEKTPAEERYGSLEDCPERRGGKNEKKKYPPSQMHQLLNFTRIFARMKPDQKVSAVLLEMERGLTGMCGDGANDAGALRAAHCGIALANGDSDASIVAPFSTSHESLFSIVECISHGRCTLATIVAGYKQLILYGEIQTILTICSNVFGIITAEPLWITWDGIVNVGMTWAVLQTRPAKKLAPYRPTARLLGGETTLSVIIQIAISWLFMCMGVVFLFEQDWFLCKEFDANRIDSSKWFLKGDNYEGSILGMMALLQFLTCGPVFSFGFDYRRTWLRNWILMLCYAGGCVLILVLLFADATFLNCLYRVNCGDWSLLERWREKGWLSWVDQSYTVPSGCACSEQIADNLRCEAEYVDCKESQFNQTYHHNILPTDFRVKFLFLMIGYVLTALLSESMIMVGPLRRVLRRKKKNRTNTQHIGNATKAQIIGLTSDHYANPNATTIQLTTVQKHTQQDKTQQKKDAAQSDQESDTHTD